MNTTMTRTRNVRSAAPDDGTHQGALSAPHLYRYHNFQVLDAAGQSVGMVDWLWADANTGHGAFIGIRMHWLRGTARVIPADGVEVDPRTSTLHVLYSAEQITRAPRCALSRVLPADQERAVLAHYALTPAMVPGLLTRGVRRARTALHTAAI